MRHAMTLISLSVWSGDGVENAFLYSSKVFTLSIHHYEDGYFPGTGTAEVVLRWRLNVDEQCHFWNPEEIPSQKHAFNTKIFASKFELFDLTSGTHPTGGG